MFLKNKQQANYYKNEHQNINGKCKNKSPPERHRPPESCNADYNQSKVGLFKNNKKCHANLANLSNLATSRHARKLKFGTDTH